MPSNVSRKKMLLPITIDEAFAEVPLPTDENLSASSGEEAFEDANAFRGKRWQEIAPAFLHRYRDSVFWFTPQAFHYYLPAFLKNCLVENDANAIYVFSILDLLRPTDDVARGRFRKERWGLLSEAQIDVLEEWLRWLLDHTTSEGVVEKEVLVALQFVRNRGWTTA